MKPATHISPFHLPVCYKDAHGEERSVLRWEAGVLQVELRGIAFSGRDFSELNTQSDRATFEKVQEVVKTLGGQRWGWWGPLTDCTFEVEFPIGLLHGGGLLSTTLTATIAIAYRERHGLNLNDYQVHMALSFDGQRYSTSKTEDSFEGALCDLQQQLPAGYFMKCCLSCKWSHYSIYGNAGFGALLCFRNVSPKPVFKDKDDLIGLDEAVIDLLEFVPETAVCGEHELMMGDDWGYKGWQPGLFKQA